MSEVLVGRDLVKNYVKGSKPIHVLRGTSLVLHSGEFVSVMGASGTGKSTLLHLLGALDSPTSGEVEIEGEKVDFESDVEMSRIRNRKVGFVFQFHHLLPDFTALENVLIPAKIAGDDRNAADLRAQSLLTGLGLCDRLEHRPSELSGGEQQRVAVARALINQPAILLMDEPTGNLDRESGETLMDLLLDFQRAKNLSIVMVTHNEVLAARTQSVYRLEDGLLHPELTVDSAGFQPGGRQ